MIDEQKRIKDWESRLRSIWGARPDITHFINHVAFSLTIRDLDISAYVERDMEAFKEQQALTKKA